MGFQPRDDIADAQQCLQNKQSYANIFFNVVVSFLKYACAEQRNKRDHACIDDKCRCHAIFLLMISIYYHQPDRFLNASYMDMVP